MNVYCKARSTLRKILDFEANRSLLLASIACLIQTFASMPAGAQSELPNQPIRVVVAVGAGGATDMIARHMAERLQVDINRTVFVEAIPAASGVVGATTVAQAAPDGATILIGTPTTHASNKVFLKDLPYDPIADFEPIALLGWATYVLCVDNTLPVNSVAELVAYAKDNPGKLSFGAGTGSARMAGEMFKAKTGIDIFSIPYRGNAAAVQDLLGSRLSMIFGDWTLMQPHVQSGGCKALAVSSPQRSVLAPNLPTMQEAGVEEYQLAGFMAAFAPAETPSTVVNYLNRHMMAILEDASFQETLLSIGIEPAEPTTPAELGEYIFEEAARWQEIADVAGIQPE